MSERRKGRISIPQLSNVMMHSQCYAEINQLVQGDEIPGFIAAYKQRIDFLSRNIGRETIHRSWFEVLKKAHGLRSIRFMKFRILRILYMLESNKAFLLLAFEERQGHKNTEYTNYIDFAWKRLYEKEKMR